MYQCEMSCCHDRQGVCLPRVSLGPSSAVRRRPVWAAVPRLQTLVSPKEVSGEVSGEVRSGI